MSWEKFILVGKCSKKKPMLSIAKDAKFLILNVGAIRQFELEKFNFAMLFFDIQEKRIGIKFFKDSTNLENVYKVRIRKNKGYAYISAQGYIKYYKLDKLLNRKMNIYRDTDSKMFVAKIKGITEKS